jgi:superfamily II DNA or RNA helicase
MSFRSKSSYKSRFFAKNKKIEKEVYVLNENNKNIICSQSYIGKKGYTIPKSAITKEEDEFLRKDLFLKPEIQTAFIGGGAAGQEDMAFPVYRESDQKMYIPRFYGIKRYGFPTGQQPCRIDQGDDIYGVEFSKTLRDYQVKIVDTYINYVSNQPFGAGGAILEVPCAAGKTVMALYIISVLKKKTLILVHKEFLMNQWIERIREFLPNASVGKIQAQVVDIENKDIVIGMIQSLYNRESTEDLFSSFGFTIIDEVHRIGSFQFSKTLLKVITPYMLGISATVERKDKLTTLLYMFIGDKIYSEERKHDDFVCVRSIKYFSNNDEFSETEYDKRGNPMYSRMIVKLCEFHPRTEFILRVVRDLINENNEKQIMILAHNRSLLTYLHDAIQHREFATVGYYVGGMKQCDLQETETKQIVIATYAMAAEALDIKTLSTLIMVTPKTDIVQSVGRILRVKHNNPIIVDIVDTHSIFQNQWTQRMQYYKKCNYRIRQISSSQYQTMSIDWEADTTWKRIFEPKKPCDEVKYKTTNDFFGKNSKKSITDKEDSHEGNTIFSKCMIDVKDFDEDK